MRSVIDRLGVYRIGRDGGSACYDSDPADACPPFFRDEDLQRQARRNRARLDLVDAEGKTLGRIATQIAERLRGKGKTSYTPHVDTGDFVVVINAEKIAVTGKKLDEKMYYRHSGYPGGLRERTLREQLERQPTEVLRKAVKGMLPRNKLGRAQLTKLKIYVGPEHPHSHRHRLPSRCKWRLPLSISAPASARRRSPA